MFFGIFETYTSSTYLRKKYPSFTVNKLNSRVYEMCLSKLKSEGFYNIEANEEYCDIYAEKNGFEISIQISQNGSTSFVEMSIFGEHKRGRTRGFFKRYYLILKNYLTSN